MNQSLSMKSYREGQLVAQKLLKRMPEDHAHSPGIMLKSSSQTDIGAKAEPASDGDQRKTKRNPGTIIPRENKSSMKRFAISNRYKVITRLYTVIIDIAVADDYARYSYRTFVFNSL